MSIEENIREQSFTIFLLSKENTTKVGHFLREWGLLEMTMTSRVSLYTLIAIAPFSWGGLLLFTYYIPPINTLSFVAVLIILLVALTSTFAPIAYVLGRRLLSARRYHVTMRSAIRQGVLLALVIILNLIFRALDSWNIFMAFVILAAAIIVEVLFLARK
jgi:hypothetical protein